MTPHVALVSADGSQSVQSDNPHLVRFVTLFMREAASDIADVDGQAKRSSKRA